VTLARKQGGFDFRQADAAAKPFATRYYSAHLHTGTQVLPPFVAEALGQ
jgi:spermidine synthase